MAATLANFAANGRSRAQLDAGTSCSAATNRAAKFAASRRFAAKIGLWGVEALERITRYALPHFSWHSPIFARNAAHEDYRTTDSLRARK